MKEIIYRNEKEYLITDKEFKEALLKWDDKSPYWCRRLQAMLTPYFESAETPRDEFGRDILIDPNDKHERRYFIKDDECIEILSFNNGLLETKFIDEKMKRGFFKKLVSQDDFYDKRKLLT